MSLLIRLAIAAVSGSASMLLLLGVLEREVNPRRMLFLGLLTGLGTGCVLELVNRRTVDPIAALTLQLTRLDLPPADAVALAEQLGKMQALSGGANITKHQTPNS